jgi:CPA1 family monovalent cation:H+ antiporter
MNMISFEKSRHLLIMTFFAIITSLFAISSIFSYINARWIKLPGVIGVMLLAIASALITVFAGKMVPQFTRLITELAPGSRISFGHKAMLSAQEVFGGLALGLLFGWIAFKMIQAIRDFQTIVMISLTLVMIISAIGSALHVSVPLAVVAAGLLIGSHPAGKEEESKLNDYLQQIWKLFDELLNTILFVLIGLQMVSVSFRTEYFIAGGLAIVILLVARTLSIFLPIVFLRRTLRMQYNSIFILTWAGLRGGISVALALSLPVSPYRELILTASFCIVVFSIVVQGLTLNKVVNKLV